jgi:hypothetical protein
MAFSNALRAKSESSMATRIFISIPPFFFV